MKRKQRKKRRLLTGPLHANIKHLREARGLTQTDLAEKLGIDKSNVWHWENGFSRPDHDILPALARALRTSIDRLFRECEVAA